MKLVRKKEEKGKGKKRKGEKRKKGGKKEKEKNFLALQLPPKVPDDTLRTSYWLKGSNWS